MNLICFSQKKCYIRTIKNHLLSPDSDEMLPDEKNIKKIW